MQADDDRARIQRLEQRLDRLEELLNSIIAYAEIEPSDLPPGIETPPPLIAAQSAEPVPIAPAARAESPQRVVPQVPVEVHEVSTLSPAPDAVLAARLKDTIPEASPAPKAPAHAQIQPRADTSKYQIALPFTPPAIPARAEIPPPRISRPAPVEAAGTTAQAGSLHHNRENGSVRGNRESGGLEQAIGLKWAGWIGAVVLIISAGMGFVYAYDQGWFDHVPPSLKLILMALVGFALIGAGEFVYRRINALSSTGLFGTGVSILFIVAYAGNQYYQLYTPGTAFWVMALAVLLGVLIALRGNFMSIAVLSIIGGNLVPILLSSGEPPGVTLLIYVLFLQILALAPSFFGREPKWWTLRTISLISTTVWTLIVLEANATATHTLLFFELLNAALFHAEAVASSASYSSRGRDGILLNVPASEKAGGVVFSLIATVVLCGFGLLTLNDEPRHLKTSWVVALALFYGWQGLMLSARFGERLRPQAEGFKVQAALLLMLAVPVGLRGFWMTGGWGFLALAFVALGARLKLPETRVFAAVTMLMGFAKWFLWDTGWWCGGSDYAGQMLVFNGYCGAALILAFACIASYALSKNRQPEKSDAGAPAFRFALACAPVALLFWAGSVEIHRYSGNKNPFDWEGTGLFFTREQFMLTDYWSALAMLLAAAHFLLNKIGRKLDGNPLRFSALIVLLLAFGKWALCDALSWALTNGSAAGAAAFGINAFGLASLMVVLAVMLCANLCADSESEKNEAPGANDSVLMGMEFAVAFCVFWAGTMEICRRFGAEPGTIWDSGKSAFTFEHLLLTGFWSGLSIVIALTHFWRGKSNSSPSMTAFRWASLGLLFMSAGKWFAVDSLAWSMGTASTPPAGPLLNLFGLNVLLLLGANAANGWLSGEKGSRNEPYPNFKTGLAYWGAITVFWAGSWEIHRCFKQLVTGNALNGMEASLAEQIFLTGYWLALSIVFAAVHAWRGRRGAVPAATAFRNSALALLFLAGGKWFVVDTLMWATGSGSTPPASPVMNAFGLDLLLLLLAHAAAGKASGNEQNSNFKTNLAYAGAIAIFWGGSWEIHRCFNQLAAGAGMNGMDASLAEQLSLSLFWSVFALTLIVTGFVFFARRRATRGWDCSC